MPATLRAGRPPRSRENLVAELRRQIVRGELPPGSRLPTRQELIRRFNTGNPTVNNALQCLIREGFVQSDGVRGTFVTPNPPHLCTYGLVFPRVVVETRYFRALRTAARAVFDTESRRLAVYESVGDKPADPKNLRLLDDVANHRLAGVIMTWTGGEFAGSTLYDPACDVPRVALHTPPAGSGVPSVTIEWQAFFDRAVERLMAQGRRKIASIAVGDDTGEYIEASSATARCGAEYRRYWHHRIGPRCYSAARNATHLLMSLAPADRPDALIIADDNLVEHAQAGLIDAGVKVPHDLTIVAHCNWPEPPAAIFPLTRLGYDATAMMSTCADLIDRRRRGEETTASLSVAPLFEDELSRAGKPGFPPAAAAALSGSSTI